RAERRGGFRQGGDRRREGEGDGQGSGSRRPRENREGAPEARAEGRSDGGERRGGKFGGGGPKGEGRGGKPKGARPGKPEGKRGYDAPLPRKDKPIDPDSPFAVLAALKNKP
ncbi:MAG TPA: disulfide oxidoreductase, partial [Paracoccus sp. (in: a-proteobacteria)]|nr:disulfide oxidoreductase [Paracoccus sp. (in: a-proteobacteria)]